MHLRHPVAHRPGHKPTAEAEELHSPNHRACVATLGPLPAAASTKAWALYASAQGQLYLVLLSVAGDKPNRANRLLTVG